MTKIYHRYQIKKPSNRTYKNHLMITHPELAKEFDEEKNVGLKIENITYGSERKIWWKCQTCNESWCHSVFRRTLGQGECPNCKRERIEKTTTIACNYPHLIEEWNDELNAPYTPYNVRDSSTKKFHWKCSTCAYEWQAEARSRTYGGTGCKVCAHKRQREFLKNFQRVIRPNNITKTHPMLESCFDKEKNYPVTMEHVTEKSNRMLHWTCPHCNESVLVKAILFIGCKKYHHCSHCGEEMYELKE